jgi:hypothetical protein
MRRGVALPSDEVLELLVTSKVACFEYLLNFPFWFAFNDIWWQFNKVWLMLFHLLIMCEEGYVEYVVYLPMRWEFDLICDWGYYGNYLERSILPW